MPATKDAVINKEELKLRPEDIVRILSEKGSLPDSFNPYGKYKVGKLKFLGDTEPPLKKTGYHGADEWILVNDGDDELIPIYISLPKPPPVSKIDGYKLPRDEQVFRRLDMPEGISKLQTKAIDSLGERQRANYQESIQGYKIYREYWAILEAEPEKYKEEIAWMKKAWWHRIYGYWFYNDGQPTYITGDYFDFLQFWYISEANTHPEYRDKDRIKYNFAKYIEECTETFESMDKDTGRALKEADGTYKMRDIGRRVFFGDVEPKTRRSGATHQCVHKVWKGNSTTEGAYGTIISMEGRNAEKHYFRKLLPAWDKYPMFLRPIWTGNRRPTSIKMIEPPTVYDMEGLNSMIDYTDSAGERKNDGDRLNYVLQDEMGKCFGYGTEIIMADGSIKRVQDIRDGEQVMGDDGTPRNVYGCTHGDSEMFSVTSKFGEFICNKEHILSLRSSAAVAGCKSAGEIVNIPLVDVLKLSDNVKRNLKVYKKPITYKEQHIDIDPYMLGVWLGDGSSYGASITNIDNEIIEYIEGYCNKNGLKVSVRDKITHYITGDNNNCIEEYNDGEYVRAYSSLTEAAIAHGRSTAWVKHFSLDNKIGHHKRNKTRFRILKHGNGLVKSLRMYGLINNKHIPECYLKNSFNVRLQLLAGIIDTDGSRSKKPTSLCYEITQKKRLLAEQIYHLANSIGFHATLTPKMARMKREDGSYYSCEVYRVRMYGDLYKVPVKVKYKQYTEPHGCRNRSPNTSWFKIKSIGQGKYYGFAVDGNHLFLLKNQIVVHNTITSDVFERWNVNKIAMSTGGGTNIIKNSYAKNPSTVEEMESGGVSYYKLCQLSCFYERMHIKGQTYSGLARIFFPAYVGLEGYIDKFGKSVIDTPTERQIKLSPNALFAMSKKGAKETLQEERDMLLTKGTPEALEQYRSLRRKHPFCWEECWLGSAGSVGFDLEILDKRLGEINREKSFGKLPYKIGNLRRVSDENSEVVFEENREGKFKISMLLPEGLTNRRTQEMGFDASKGAYVPMWKPIGGEMFTLGADPFQYMNKNLAKQSVIQSRQSDGGLAVLYDDRKGKQCFVLSYRNRPASQHEYMEDAIMACQYFSCMCYPETNITDLYKHFIERGYGGYLLYQIDIQTGRFKDKPGEFTRQESRDGYFAAVKDFIQFHGAEENHDDILKEFRDIKGPDDMTHYDLFTAAALALRGNMTRTRQVIESQNSMVIDLGDIGMFRKKRF